jgi:hypothetical protein
MKDANATKALAKLRSINSISDYYLRFKFKTIHNLIFCLTYVWHSVKKLVSIIIKTFIFMLSKALEKPYEKNEHVMDKNSGDCSWSDFNRWRRRYA